MMTKCTIRTVKNFCRLICGLLFEAAIFSSRVIAVQCFTEFSNQNCLAFDAMDSTIFTNLISVKYTSLFRFVFPQGIELSSTQLRNNNKLRCTNYKRFSL